VILDTWRGVVRRERELSGTADLMLEYADVAAIMDSGDVREQRLLYLLFHCGFSPKEIVCTCPHEFNDLQEVYRLRQDIVVRLLSNSAFSDCW
jgi:acetone carboxylase gamma subunit